MPFFSIIVPIYNCDKHLKKCIDSLIHQSFNNIEIILINDGSKDNSKEIINEYAKNHKRIIAFHQENKGVSIARNVGLKLATGDYVSFIDADDYVELDMYEKIYDKFLIHNVDVIVFDFFRETNDFDKKEMLLMSGMSKEYLQNHNDVVYEIMPKLIDDTLSGYSCNKIYKRSIIKENHIIFPENIKLMEDCVFNWCFFSEANSVSFIKEPLYHYVFHNNSALSKYQPEIFNQLLLFLNIKDLFYKKWQLWKINSDIKKIYNVWKVKMIINIIIQLLKRSKEYSLLNRIKLVNNAIKHPVVTEIFKEEDAFTGTNRFLSVVLKNQITILVVIYLPVARIFNAVYRRLLLVFKKLKRRFKNVKQ